MKLQEILNKNCIYLNVDCKNKEETLEFLVTHLKENGIISNINDFLKAVHEREKLSPTGLLKGIAIPHGISEIVIRPAVIYSRLITPVQWESMDNSDAQNIFLLAIPDRKGDNTHIKMLSELARSLMRDETIEELNEAKTSDEVLDVLTKGGEKT